MEEEIGDETGSRMKGGGNERRCEGEGWDGRTGRGSTGSADRGTCTRLTPSLISVRAATTIRVWSAFLRPRHRLDPDRDDVSAFLVLPIRHALPLNTPSRFPFEQPLVRVVDSTSHVALGKHHHHKTVT